MRTVVSMGASTALSLLTVTSCVSLRVGAMTDVDNPGNVVPHASLVLELEHLRWKAPHRRLGSRSP